MGHRGPTLDAPSSSRGQLGTQHRAHPKWTRPSDAACQRVIGQTVRQVTVPLAVLVNL